eukprot:TRINITY_DN24378_c0_g1_i1.p1 TRINITY_DN24378_c0_g1~~TRINITY_DN24378_c0_g1_i1.p1  ORF type:complete len:3305 (+),score=1313.80 TRINITY_DN24378_c0_g1_i1:103-9915(+)
MARAKLKAEDRELLRAEFDQRDVNKDGELDLSEFRKFIQDTFKRGGISKAEINELVPQAFGKIEEETGEEMKVNFEEYIEFQSADPSMRFDVHFIRSQQQAAEDRIGLALYIPFLLLFTFYLVTGKGLGYSYWMQSSVMAHMIGDEFQQGPDLRYFKGYEDQAKIEEFYDWFDWPFVNTLWQGEAGDIAKDPVNAFNLPIGAMRLRQVRVQPIQCGQGVLNLKSNAESQLNWSTRAKRLEQFGHPCFPEYEAGSPDNLPHPMEILPGAVNGSFSVSRIAVNSWMDPRQKALVENAYSWRPAKELQASAAAFFAGKISVYPPDGYGLVIPFSYNKSLFTEISGLLKGGVSICTGQIAQGQCVNGVVKTIPWLDQQTRAISVEFMTWNQNLALVTRVQMFVEVTASGYFLPLNYVTTFQFFDWGQHGMFYFLGMFIVIIYIVSFWVKWIRGFWRATKTYVLERQKQGFVVHLEAMFQTFTSDFWIVFDFVNLMLFAIVWLLRFQWIGLSFTQTSVLSMDKYPTEWEDVNEVVVTMSSIDAFNALLCFLRIFYYLRLNTRLNLLTKTIDMAKTELFGILFIFVIMFIGFALMAFVVYGNVLEEFRSFTETITTLLLMLLGAFDYPAWREQRRLFTPIIFLLFTVIGNFLLLNMVIAVLNSAFGLVQEAKFKADKVRALLNAVADNAEPESEDANLAEKLEVRYRGCCYWFKSTALWREIAWTMGMLRLYMTNKHDLPGGAQEWYEKQREIDEANPRTFWTHQNHLMFLLKRCVDFRDKLRLNPVPITHHLLDMFGEDLTEVIALWYVSPGESQHRSEEDRRRDHIANHDLCKVAAHHLGRNPQQLLLDLMDFNHTWQRQVAPRYASLEEEDENEGDSDDDAGGEKELVYDPEDEAGGIAMRGTEEVRKQRQTNIQLWRHHVQKAKEKIAVANRLYGESAEADNAAEKLMREELAREAEQQQLAQLNKKRRQDAKETLEQLYEQRHFQMQIQGIDNVQHYIDRLQSAATGQSSDGGHFLDAKSLLVPECLVIEGGPSVTVTENGTTVKYSANGRYHRSGMRNGKPLWRRKYNLDGRPYGEPKGVHYKDMCVLWGDGCWWIGCPREKPYDRMCVPAVHWWRDSESILPPLGTDAGSSLMRYNWESVIDGGHGTAPTITYHSSSRQGSGAVETGKSGRRVSIVKVNLGVGRKSVELPRRVRVSGAGSAECNGDYELMSLDPQKQIPLIRNTRPVWRKHYHRVLRNFSTEDFVLRSDKQQYCYIRRAFRECRDDIVQRHNVTLRVPAENARAERMVEIEGDWQATEQAYQDLVAVAREERQRLDLIRFIDSMCTHSREYKKWFQEQGKRQYHERFGQRQRKRSKKVDPAVLMHEAQDKENFLSPYDYRHEMAYLKRSAQGLRHHHGDEGDIVTDHEHWAPGCSRHRADELMTVIGEWEINSDQDILPEVFQRMDRSGELVARPDSEVLGTHGPEGDEGLLSLVHKWMQRGIFPQHVWDDQLPQAEAGYDIDLYWDGGRWVLGERVQRSARGALNFRDRPPKTYLMILGERDGPNGDLLYSESKVGSGVHAITPVDILSRKAGSKAEVGKLLRNDPGDPWRVPFTCCYQFDGDADKGLSAQYLGWNREQFLRYIPAVLAFYSEAWQALWTLGKVTTELRLEHGGDQDKQQALLERSDHMMAATWKKVVDQLRELEERELEESESLQFGASDSGPAAEPEVCEPDDAFDVEDFHQRVERARPNWKGIEDVPVEAFVPLRCTPRNPQVGVDDAEAGDPDWPFKEHSDCHWYSNAHSAVLYGVRAQGVFPRGDVVTAEVRVPRGKCKGTWLQCEIERTPADDDVKKMYMVRVWWETALRNSNSYLHQSYLRERRSKPHSRLSDVFRVTEHELRKRNGMGADFWCSMLSTWINDTTHRIHKDFPGLLRAYTETNPQVRTLYACEDPSTRNHPPLFETYWHPGQRQEDGGSPSAALAATGVGSPAALAATGRAAARDTSGWFKGVCSTISVTGLTRVRFRKTEIGRANGAPRYLALHHAYTQSWYSPAAGAKGGDDARFWESGCDCPEPDAERPDMEFTPPRPAADAPAAVLAAETQYDSWLRVTEPAPPEGVSRWIKRDSWAKVHSGVPNLPFLGALQTRDMLNRGSAADSAVESVMTVCGHEWRNEATVWELEREKKRGGRVFVRKAIASRPLTIESDDRHVLHFVHVSAGDEVVIQRYDHSKVQWRALVTGKADAASGAARVLLEWAPPEAGGPPEPVPPSELSNEQWDEARARPLEPDPMGALGMRCQGNRVAHVEPGGRAERAGILAGMTLLRCCGQEVRSDCRESEVGAMLPPGKGAECRLIVSEESVDHAAGRVAGGSMDYPAGYKGDGRYRYLTAARGDQRELGGIAEPDEPVRPVGNSLWVTAQEAQLQDALWDLLPSWGYAHSERRRDGRDNKWRTYSEFMELHLGEADMQTLDYPHRYHPDEVARARERRAPLEEEWAGLTPERVDPRPEDEDDVEWWQQDHHIRDWLRHDMREESEAGERLGLVTVQRGWVPKGRWCARSEADMTPADTAALAERVAWYHNNWRLLCDKKMEPLSFQDAREGMVVELSPKQDERTPAQKARYIAVIKDKREDSVFVRWRGKRPPGVPETWRCKLEWWDPRQSTAYQELQREKAKYRKENGGIPPTKRALARQPFAKHIRQLANLQGVSPMCTPEEKTAKSHRGRATGAAKRDERSLQLRQLLAEELQRQQHKVMLRAAGSSRQLDGGDRYLSLWLNYPSQPTLHHGDEAFAGRWVCDTFPGEAGNEKVAVLISRNRTVATTGEKCIVGEWVISAHRCEGAEGAEVEVQPPQSERGVRRGTIQSIRKDAVWVKFEGDEQAIELPRAYWDSAWKTFPGAELAGSWDVESASGALLWRATWPPRQSRSGAAPVSSTGRPDALLTGRVDSGHGLYWRNQRTKKVKMFDIEVTQRSMQELELVVKEWKDLGHNWSFVFRRQDDLRRDDLSLCAVAVNDRTAASHTLWEVEPVQELDTVVEDAVKQAMREARHQLRNEFCDLIRTEMEFLFRTAVPNLLTDFGSNELVQTLNFKMTKESANAAELREKINKGKAIAPAQGEERRPRPPDSRVTEWAAGQQPGSGLIPATSFDAQPERTVRHADARPFTLVRLRSQSAGVAAGPFLGVISDKDEKGVVIHFYPPEHGGPPRAPGQGARQDFERQDSAFFDGQAGAQLICYVPDPSELQGRSPEEKRQIVDTLGGSWQAEAQQPGLTSDRASQIIKDWRIWAAPPAAGV